MENSKKSWWPYIIIGMLSMTGVTNYLLVYFSSSVYSAPVSKSPYNDSLEYDNKLSELKCAEEKGYAFQLLSNNSTAEIKSIGNLPSVDEVQVKGWSGSVETLDEVVKFNGTTAKLKSSLTKGLWNLEISGADKNENACAWRVVVKGII